MTEIDPAIDMVNKVTAWLKERDGEHPTHEQIELELARRTIEAVAMYQDVSRQLVQYKVSRP